eukprot:4637723-Amphidinium_carterae.1
MQCTRRLLVGVHPTHTTHLFRVVDATGHDFGQLVSCIICGGYAATKLGKLGQAVQPCYDDVSHMSRKREGGKLNILGPRGHT